MLASGDSTWFATFRMKVRQQMLQLSEEAVPQVTQTMVQQVWMTSAKSQTKQANAAGKQCRKIFDTALAQLHQQREIVLVGTAARLLARKKLVAAMRATVTSGALPKVLRAEAVVDVTKAVPVRDVVIAMDRLWTVTMTRREHSRAHAQGKVQAQRSRGRQSNCDTRQGAEDCL